MINAAKTTIAGPSTVDALRRTAHEILMQDFEAGRLAPVVVAAVHQPEQVAPFLKGMEIGLALGLTLMLSGQLDLQLVEIDLPTTAG